MRRELATSLSCAFTGEHGNRVFTARDDNGDMFMELQVVVGT